MPRRGKSFKVSLSSLPASSEQQVLEEKGTVLLRHLPTLFKGWVASAYILSCAPPACQVARERATQWHGGIAKGMLPAAADIK